MNDEMDMCLWCEQILAPAASHCPRCGLELGPNVVKNALLMGLRAGYKWAARDFGSTDYLVLFSTRPTRHKDEDGRPFWGYANEGYGELPAWPIAVNGVLAPNVACEIADLIAPPELFQPLMQHVMESAAQPASRPRFKEQTRWRHDQ